MVKHEQLCVVFHIVDGALRVGALSTTLSLSGIVCAVSYQVELALSRTMISKAFLSSAGLGEARDEKLRVFFFHFNHSDNRTDERMRQGVSEWIKG